MIVHLHRTRAQVTFANGTCSIPCVKYGTFKSCDLDAISVPSRMIYHLVQGSRFRTLSARKYLCELLYFLFNNLIIFSIWLVAMGFRSHFMTLKETLSVWARIMEHMPLDGSAKWKFDSKVLLFHSLHIYYSSFTQYGLSARQWYACKAQCGKYRAF